MIEQTKTTYTVKASFPDGSELICSYLTKDQAEWLEMKLTAPTHVLPKADVKANEWERINTAYGVHHYHKKHGIGLYKLTEVNHGLWFLRNRVRQSLSKEWWCCGVQEEDFNTGLTDIYAEKALALNAFRIEAARD